jgi:thiol:disulfide interchange protein
MIGINADLNEGNLRTLGFIFVCSLFIGVIYLGTLIKLDSFPNWILLISLYLSAILLLILDVLPLLLSIMKSYIVKDNYANQIRIHQELENIKLANELREKRKKPIIKNLYSDSVKLHLGIPIKKISFWERLFGIKKKKKKKLNKKS